VSEFLEVVRRKVSLREAIRCEVEEDIGFLVRHLPGVVGFALRYLAYKPLFARIGSMPFIQPGVRFTYTNGISLGKAVGINTGTYFYGKGGVEIGDNVMIAPNCCLIAGTADLETGSPLIMRPVRPERIVVGRDSWLGANVVVLGGVTIGESSVIGANAVVTKDTEPYSINVGAPARKIGDRRERRPKAEGRAEAESSSA